jgi:CRP-like cAMP-binding protein
MEIVLDAMRMLDDGIIKPVGTAFSQEAVDTGKENQGSSVKEPGQTVIKGPFVDYMYVVDEDAFRDGTKIVTEGGHGSWIWVILEGTAQVTRAVSSGTLELARLGEGCFIGTVISFVERNYMRNATVTAVGDLQVGVLDTQRLYQKYVSFSDDLQRLILSLEGRLQKITDRAASLYEKRKDVLKLPENKKLVLKQGSSKDGAYVITEGNAYIVRKTRNGCRPLVCLEKGDVFGNIPFVDTGLEPRYAAVVASEGLKVNKIDVRALQEEYKQLPAIFKNLMEGVCTCVSVTTHLASNL